MACREILIASQQNPEMVCGETRREFIKLLHMLIHHMTPKTRGACVLSVRRAIGKEVIMADKFQIGDKLDYSFYKNLVVVAADANHYILQDSRGGKQPVYKGLVDKHGRLISEKG